MVSIHIHQKWLTCLEMAAEFRDVSISISGNRWLEYSELEKKQPSFVAFGLKCCSLLNGDVAMSRCQFWWPNCLQWQIILLDSYMSPLGVSREINWRSYPKNRRTSADRPTWTWDEIHGFNDVNKETSSARIWISIALQTCRRSFLNCNVTSRLPKTLRKWNPLHMVCLFIRI